MGLCKAANEFLLVFGIDVRKAKRAIMDLPSYFRDFRAIKAQMVTKKDEFPIAKFYPCLGEREVSSGSAKGHYFHQDLYVARRIFECGPAVHLDVGSRIDGFVAHVATFRPIEVIDIRPQASTVPNISFLQADLMSSLDDKLVGYCDSLSCLHTLEHFGLGRYGDTIDCEGHLRGLKNLCRMLKTGGKLYLSVPIGPQRIEFNAHRVFSVQYLMRCLSPNFITEAFSYIDDSGDLHVNVSLEDGEYMNNFGCHYGCGVFELRKN